jgi:hypothetical protein
MDWLLEAAVRRYLAIERAAHISNFPRNFTVGRIVLVGFGILSGVKTIRQEDPPG